MTVLTDFLILEMLVHIRIIILQTVFGSKYLSISALCWIATHETKNQFAGIALFTKPWIKTAMRLNTQLNSEETEDLQCVLCVDKGMSI